MFTSEPSDTLLQGDVCATNDFPIWDLRKTGIVNNADGTHGAMLPSLDRGVRPPGSTKMLVIVCSHSCDIENPRTRTGLLVAPLVPVPASPSDTKRLAEIMGSHTPNGDEYAYLQLFPFALPAHLGGAKVAADLSCMTAMIRVEDAVKRLLPRKLLELDDATRRLFGKKLGVFIGRP